MPSSSDTNEPAAQAAIDVPDPFAPESDAGELHGLVERFAALGRSLDRANERMTAYLLRRDAQPAVSAEPHEGASALAERIEALAEKLDQLSQAIPPQATPADDGIALALAALRQAVADQKEFVAASIDNLGRRIDDGLAQLTDRLCPVQEAQQETFAMPATSDDWLRAILGPMLANDPSLESDRRQFADDVLSDNPGACSLAGQLLVFQSASPERMPALLRDIGEAYYRWQPKRDPVNTSMEEALAAWLQRACDNAGISNSIALVHPGERFDAARHSATGRGVEITDVFGWVVLRDNGKVYTKAGVAVR
jgi:hypothetical protein